MHVLINEADVTIGVSELDRQYRYVLSSIDIIELALTNNVTTVLLLDLYVKGRGVHLDHLWLKRAASYVSLMRKLPIPNALVLRDSEFFSFVLVCRLMRWS